MANQTSNINFTAVVDTAAKTITLQNTGVYNPGVSLYSWSVLCPSGAIRTLTGINAVISLPPAADGTIQTGNYAITASVVDTDTVPQTSSITRPLTITLSDIQPILSKVENYTSPSVVYSDTQTYAMPGYTIQSIVRAWRADRTGSNIPITYTGTASIFNLGTIYRSTYTVKQAVVVTYQKVGATWATVVVTYTAQETFQPKIFPSKTEMLGWIGAADDANCGCEDGNVSGCIYKLLTDFYCAGDITQSWRQALKLYRETHYKAAYRPTYDDQALVGVSYCTGAGSALSIATQPVGGNLVGGVLQLSVVLAGGSAPYTYQWYNGAGIINGATDAGYTAPGVGGYYVIGTDSLGATVTSQTATVTSSGGGTGVNVDYWYSNVNPYVDNNTAPTPNGTLASISIVHNAPIPITWPSAAEGMFLIERIPSTESAKTIWVNGITNGAIPDQVIRDGFTVGNSTYYITRNNAGFSFDNGNYVLTLS